MGKAIQAIYRDLEYAKTLVQQRSIASSTPAAPDAAGQVADDDLDLDDWTFIEDDIDIGDDDDTVKRKQD